MRDWTKLTHSGRPCFVDEGGNWYAYYPTGSPKHIATKPGTIIVVQPKEPPAPEVRFVDILPDGWL